MKFIGSALGLLIFTENFKLGNIFFLVYIYMDLQFQVHFNIYLYMYIPIFLLLEFLCGFFFVKPCFMTTSISMIGCHAACINADDTVK